MVAETRDVITITKKDIIKRNIPKRLRKRIRSINNGYLRAKILVRLRKD